MRCDVHCPPAGTLLARAAAVLAAAAAVRLAWLMVSSAVEAAALVILAACVPASWATWRLVRYGSLRKPRRVKLGDRADIAAVVTSLTPATKALPAPPKAITAPRRVLDGVIISEKEAVR